MKMFQTDKPYHIFIHCTCNSVYRIHCTLLCTNNHPKDKLVHLHNTRYTKMDNTTIQETTHRTVYTTTTVAGTHTTLQIPGRYLPTPQSTN